MTAKLGQVRQFGYDFDGVFYPHASVPNLFAEFAHAKGLAAHQLTNGLIPVARASAIGHAGYKKNGDSVTALSEWAGRNGYNREEFRTKLFRLIHEIIIKRFFEIAPNVFTHQKELAESFQRTAHIPRGIATHGCATTYATPLLDALGVLPFIRQDSMFGLDNADFKTKTKHADLMLMCLNALGHDLSVQAFVEDTVKNLQVLKEQTPNVTTVFIHHGTPLEGKLPSYIDFQFRDLIALHAAHERAATDERTLILT